MQESTQQQEKQRIKRGRKKKQDIDNAQPLDKAVAEQIEHGSGRVVTLDEEVAELRQDFNRLAQCVARLAHQAGGDIIVREYGFETYKPSKASMSKFQKG